MGSALAFGSIVYYLDCVGEAILLGMMLKRKTYRQYPLFFAYITLCCLRSANALTFYFQMDAVAYGRLLNVCLPLAFVLILAVCGELLLKAYPVPKLARMTQFAGVVPAGCFFANPHVSLDIGFSVVVCLVLAAIVPKLHTLPRSAQAIMVGMFLINFFPLIVKTSGACYSFHAYCGYVPTVAFALALGCWLPAFPQTRSRIL